MMHVLIYVINNLVQQHVCAKQQCQKHSDFLYKICSANDPQKKYRLGTVRKSDVKKEEESSTKQLWFGLVVCDCGIS